MTTPDRLPGQGRGHIVDAFESTDTRVCLRHILLQKHDDDKIWTVVVSNFDYACVVEFDTRANATKAFNAIVTTTLSRNR